MTKLAIDLRATHSNDGDVLLHLGTGQMYTVNSVGARILTLLATGATNIQISERISQEFSADPETVRNDVCEFLAHLAQHRIVALEHQAPSNEATGKKL
jgi:hypothetical protein